MKGLREKLPNSYQTPRPCESEAGFEKNLVDSLLAKDYKVHHQNV